jgi:tRNA A-37 threonylcarbamoyl transferase component Bud32
VPPPPPAETSRAPTRTLAGRYRLGELLGRGAHGEVRAAHDLRLDREVAVKLLRPDVVDDPELRRRFVAEGHAAAQLVHPHVVAVFDAGDDGVPFLVMERLPGTSVAGEIARGPLPVARACVVASQVLAALGAAHALGIVHRDIKPANVLLTADGTAKVADFGIAKLASAMERTSTGVVVGTPAYLAPEVLAGAPASPASDVWAVGCLLHEMLTGAKPFRGDEPLALVHAIVSTTPERVDARRADVPSAVADVVARALRADTAARWASADQMEAALRAAAGAGSLGVDGRATATVSPMGGTAELPATRLGPPVAPTSVWLAPGPVPTAATRPSPAPGPTGPPRRRALLGVALLALAVAIAGAIVLSGDDASPETPTDGSSGSAAVTTTAAVATPTTAPVTTSAPTDDPAPTEPAASGGDGNGNGRGNGNGNGNDR